MAKKEFPEIKKKNEGKFTAWVEKNMGGMDTCKAASKVMRSRTKKYSSAVVKMANYANNFGCKTKKEDGASVPLKGNQKNLPEGLRKKILDSDGASVKKPPLKKIKSKKAITGLEKLKIRKGPKGTKYEGKQRMERGSEEGSHSYYSDNISEHKSQEFDTNKSTQQQVTETGKYRTKEREKRHMKAALKSAKKK